LASAISAHQWTTPLPTGKWAPVRGCSWSSESWIIYGWSRLSKRCTTYTSRRL
jgi:hypothetical protein